MSRPIITLLSGSPSASRRTQALLFSMFSMTPIALGSTDGKIFTPNDDLNSSLTITSRSRLCYESTASVCSRSGAVLHFLSLAQCSSTAPESPTSAEPTLKLISITDYESEDDPGEANYIKAILNARSSISDQLNKESYNVFSRLRHSFNRIIGHSATAAFGDIGTQRNIFLKLPATTAIKSDVAGYNQSRTPSERVDRTHNSIGLREVVLPYCEDGDTDCSSLLHQLSSSCLSRPIDGTTKRSIAGLFQWHNDGSMDTKPIIIRPLPAAKADFAVSNPSFIFQCPSLMSASFEIQKHSASSAKVGFHGGRNGQLMVLHKDLMGLDIRFCENDRLSSSFDEAQQALLAGSLDGLQHPDVLQEGATYSDSNKGKASLTDGDCWVEFRENLKKPKIFLSKNFNRRDER